jgi:hypothetical protein
MFSPMANQRGSIKLDEVVRIESTDDNLEIILEQSLQLFVAYVAGGNQEQFVRLMKQQQHVDEVFILADDRALLSHGQLVNQGVPGAISLRQIPCVSGFMSLGLQPSRQPGRELRIDQELHYRTA